MFIRIEIGMVSPKNELQEKIFVCRSSMVKDNDQFRPIWIRSHWATTTAGPHSTSHHTGSKITLLIRLSECAFHMIVPRVERRQALRRTRAVDIARCSTINVNMNRPSTRPYDVERVFQILCKLLIDPSTKLPALTIPLRRAGKQPMSHRGDGPARTDEPDSAWRTHSRPRRVSRTHRPIAESNIDGAAMVVISAKLLVCPGSPIHEHPDIQSPSTPQYNSQSTAGEDNLEPRAVRVDNEMEKWREMEHGNSLFQERRTDAGAKRCGSGRGMRRALYVADVRGLADKSETRPRTRVQGFVTRTTGSSLKAQSVRRLQDWRSRLWARGLEDGQWGQRHGQRLEGALARPERCCAAARMSHACGGCLRDDRPRRGTAAPKVLAK